MITEEYRKLNAELHHRVPGYGNNGKKWASYISELHQDGQTILDYGCGKGSLARTLNAIEVREYDPAIPGKDAEPEPADIVVCTDVMEHVEIEYIDDVIANVVSLARSVVLFGICCKDGSRRLADGRPAHITIRPAEWWLDKLNGKGRIVQLPNRPDEFNALVYPK